MKNFRAALLAGCIAATSILGFSSSVSAHGGLPISEQIIFQGDTLVVPTKFWGVFFGTDGGPWRWICEEAINTDQSRRWALTGDGTFHVTDNSGLTSSRDKGCTWIEATGDISTRRTSAIVADPADGKRAWSTTNAAADLAPWNALFTTDDDGLTWTPALMGDEYFWGAAISSDGQRVYATGTKRTINSNLVDLAGIPDGGSTTPTISPPLLHMSSDGGKTFSSIPIVFLVDGVLQTYIEPLAVDPTDSDVVYLRVNGDPTAILLRATTAGDVVELARADGTVNQPGVGGVGFDVAENYLFIATRNGMYRRRLGADGGVAGVDGGNPLCGGEDGGLDGGGADGGSDGGTDPSAGSKLPFLCQAQCATKHGANLYACSWNYYPDNASIARSTDDGVTFTKVFQYSETVGPTLDCPATSPVGMICPGIWENYAVQLGIGSSPTVDAAVPDLGTATSTPKKGCGCAIGGARRPGDNGDRWALALVGVSVLRLVSDGKTRRRRRSARRS